MKKVVYEMATMERILTLLNDLQVTGVAQARILAQAADLIATGQVTEAENNVHRFKPSQKKEGE